MKALKEQTKTEEHINASLHAVGFVMAIIAMIVLVAMSLSLNNQVYLAGSVIFGLSLITLYFASMMYHFLPGGIWKDRFHLMDHVSIYLLIAGTYTPVTLIAMPGAWKWIILGAIWGAAILGILLKAFWFNRFRYFSLILYGIMGWMIIVAIKPLVTNVNPTSLFYLVCGGIFYTVGILFYIRKNLRFSHSIWHLFVLGGSICHFFMVYFIFPH